MWGAVCWHPVSLWISYVQKTLVGTMGIRQAQYVPVMRYELKDMEFVVKKWRKKLSYPMFVKSHAMLVHLAVYQR